ncbi:unnamed protein product [Colias eurytheme]|nr:unnamed protein product [Colias eurytheme]
MAEVRDQSQVLGMSRTLQAKRSKLSLATCAVLYTVSEDHKSFFEDLFVFLIHYRHAWGGVARWEGLLIGRMKGRRISSLKDCLARLRVSEHVKIADFQFYRGFAVAGNPIKKTASEASKPVFSTAQEYHLQVQTHLTANQSILD